MTDNSASSKRFRVTLIRVISVQVVTLLLLWWMQSWFSRS